MNKVEYIKHFVTDRVKPLSFVIFDIRVPYSDARLLKTHLFRKSFHDYLLDINIPLLWPHNIFFIDRLVEKNKSFYLFCTMYEIK